MQIYEATGSAIKLAQIKGMPILITPGIAYPHEKTKNYPFKTMMVGDWVLESFPAYDAKEGVPVFPISDTAEARGYLKKMPPYVTEALVGDGLNYYVVKR